MSSKELIGAVERLKRLLPLLLTSDDLHAEIDDIFGDWYQPGAMDEEDLNAFFGMQRELLSFARGQIQLDPILPFQLVEIHHAQTGDDESLVTRQWLLEFDGSYHCLASIQVCTDFPDGTEYPVEPMDDQEWLLTREKFLIFIEDYLKHVKLRKRELTRRDPKWDDHIFSVVRNEVQRILSGVPDCTKADALDEALSKSKLSKKMWENLKKARRIRGLSNGLS